MCTTKKTLVCVTSKKKNQREKAAAQAGVVREVLQLDRGLDAGLDQLDVQPFEENGEHVKILCFLDFLFSSNKEK